MFGHDMKPSLSLLILASLLAPSMVMPAQHPVVIAGLPGHAGYLDGKAVDARFENPNGLLLLPDDSLLIADTGNCRLRLLKGGQVSTFAGSGKQSSIDSKTPQQAAFVLPCCLALLPNGAILVGDSGRVRMIDRAGKVSTWLDLLETIPGSPGQVIDLLSVSNAVYVCDRINRRIYLRRGDSLPSLFYKCDKEPYSLAQRPNGDVLIGEYERIIGVRKDGSSYVYHQANKDAKEPLSDLISGMEFDALGRLIIADAYCGLLVLSEGQPAKVVSKLNGDVSSLVLTRDKKKAYVTSSHSIAIIDLPKMRPNLSLHTTTIRAHGAAVCE